MPTGTKTSKTLTQLEHSISLQSRQNLLAKSGCSLFSFSRPSMAGGCELSGGGGAGGGGAAEVSSATATPVADACWPPPWAVGRAGGSASWRVDRWCFQACAWERMRSNKLGSSEDSTIGRRSGKVRVQQHWSAGSAALKWDRWT